MAGVISVRFSTEERAELRQRWKTAGFPSLSAYIRTKLGLDPDGGIDPVTEYEDLSLTALLRSFVEVRDRIDGGNSLLKQLCRAQGIRVEHLDEPRPYTRVKPVDPPDADGIVDIPSHAQLTTTVMPAGFER
jgi:hypothetical protein